MGYSFDGPTKVISLTLGTTEVSVRDLWSRWVDWTVTSDNSKYLPAMRTTGGDTVDSGEGIYIPIYVFMLNGWKIKPQEANHILVINDGILVSEDGSNPYIATTGSYQVQIRTSQPVQAISYDAGGGGGGGGASVNDIWDEPVADHTTPGSFAALLKALPRKGFFYSKG